MGTLAADTLHLTKATAKLSSRDHVLIFPFMAKGHTIPLLHFSEALTRHGVKVTLLTTPGNSPFIEEYLALPRPNIHLATIPFPDHATAIPPGCESTDSLPCFDLHTDFLLATKPLQCPFRDFLQSLYDTHDLPVCVISDFFCGWTRPVCADFGVPRLVFHGMGTFSMFVCKYMFVDQPQKAAITDPDGFHVPGTPETLRFTAFDLPKQTDCKQLEKFYMESGYEESRSWGVVINSFSELESQYVAKLEAYYGEDARAWLVGPTSLYLAEPSRGMNGGFGGSLDGLDPCLRWLDGKAPVSVVYVSFGTQADVSDEQLDEIGCGLEMSGHDFIWVVRSATWKPPRDLLDRLEKRQTGLLHFGWAPQREVLNHPSTGGFVSHCGWNSVLEAVSAGVPIIAWPMVGDQPLNAKFMVDVVKAALRVEGSGELALVGREAICKGVNELMGGDKGKQVGGKAAELGKIARGAVEESGSSVTTLERLLHELRNARQQTFTDGGFP